MLFTDEELRHEYHKAPTLLQVVCQLLESEMSKAHLQLQVVGIEQQEAFWVALLITDHDDFEDRVDLQEAFKLAIDHVCGQFQRKDNVPTAELEHGKYGLCTVRVTSASDFARLH